MVYIAKSYGLIEVADYWEQLIIMNDYQKKRFAEKNVKTLFNTVSGKEITLLGWVFKKDTNNTRESASMYVAHELLNERANIKVYDPKLPAHKMYADLGYP